MIKEGQHLWSPRDEFAQASNVARYQRWLASERGLDFPDYASLHRWSVTDISAFWASIWDYFDVQSSTPYKQVIDQRKMPGAKWFEGSQVNYAEHLLRYEAKAKPGEVAFQHLTENRPLQQMSWQELGAQVRILATQLRAMGVQRGDRVVSYLPNIPETGIAMMATLAVGAVWSSAAPEFGVKTVTDRFSQIAPKVMFACDGYRFGGKDFSRVEEVREIASKLPTLSQLIWLPYMRPQSRDLPIENSTLWSDVMNHAPVPREGFVFERLPYDHPMWVVFSSGTTGLPKPIVHSHVGVLLEHLKLMHFHLNLRPGAPMFFYSTTGWMMWNLTMAALLTGGVPVLYDGSPMHPGPDFLWKLAADTRCVSFGASPTFVQIMEKAGLNPGATFDLSGLESILVAGSPSTPETFEWFYRCVKEDLWVTSQSGGTEVCSGFVGAVPTLPVYAGEIQARMLGMDVQAWNDEGKTVTDEVGELVVMSPFPSMPLYFWNDDNDKRYRESYFAHYEGIWRHGDYIKINPRGGCYIYGRSDSTLNRYGVRIGTAEIYRCVEQLPEIADSLIVCCELAGGRYFMPMFVQLRDGHQLDEALREKIARKLRADCSPRHVPDQLYVVEAIPYTLTGKKMELPVRKILMGWAIDKAVSRDAMMQPKAIDWFIDFTRDNREMLTG